MGSNCYIGPFRAHNRPNSRRLDASRQKSCPTSRHKTAHEQFKHTFATNLHGPTMATKSKQVQRVDLGSGPRGKFCTKRATNLGAQTRQWPITDVSFTKAKLMFSSFDGNFGIELTSCGLGPHEGHACALKCDLLKKNTVL